MGAGSLEGGEDAAKKAIKASGAVVRINPAEFLRILTRSKEPIVIVAEGGVLSKSYRYLTAYKGFIFYAQSAVPLKLMNNIEVIKANQIWTPS
jgi:hypothetical protein